MMTARASAGSLTPSLTSMVILTALGLRLDRFDGADRDADDADVVAGIQPDRRGEVADDFVTGAAGPDQVDADDEHDNEGGDDAVAQPPRTGACLRAHGDFGLMIMRSEMKPRK